MKVVSNTSPIINLANVGALQLLNLLYGNLIIPRAVFQEIAVIGAGEAGSQEVQTWPWISTHVVQNLVTVNSLRTQLDWGESEAIATAIEIQADLLLIDEKRGRLVAQQLGLTTSGILGVLLEAKQTGLIQMVKPILDSLIRKGFWVNHALYDHLLQRAGEV
jgi:uncharacterized protein